MSELMDFLIKNESDLTETAEIVLSDRLKNFTFVIKPIAGEEFNAIKSSCRKIVKKSIIFDEASYREKIILKGCLTPNFADEESIKKAGALTPGELINKTLKAGEIEELSNKISELSGFDDTAKVVEAAKN